ncbi:Nuclear autoantigenic sperm protein [Collichthys lucidus]|uniref:Nuclear autoantigenic sperm protein n=1 Tax=Collichthys lucidus TaxID=240159 RepID=A0A4U5UHQ1_COLLU|nr:Nuclear autoantigenic sperm protein [Collichthys lucidus]
MDAVLFAVARVTKRLFCVSRHPPHLFVHRFSSRPRTMPEETSSSASTADAMEEARKLIGTGKKHLVMGDVVSAVSVFQDACSMLASKYGDTADECGEAFFLCGKSLLELARMENSIFGNALQGVPEESEEEEQPSNSNIESADSLDEETREELRKQVYDAMAEEGRSGPGKLESEDGEGNTEVKKENGVAKSSVKHEEVTRSEEPSTSPVREENPVQKAEVNGVEKSPVTPVNGVESPSGSSGKETAVKDMEAKPEEESEAEQDGEQPEGSRLWIESTICWVEHKLGICWCKNGPLTDDDDCEDGETNGQEKEEDEVENLQLAWEMLEVAKVIYKRKEGKEDQLMAAQTYLKLGEVSAESGNYPQALEDFQECLSLQLKHLLPHSRLLAETHYHVATTLCYMAQYSQAIQHYNRSIQVIETRLAMLQEVTAAADGAAEEKNEMEELKQLLPDIRGKVEDAKESQRTAIAASQAIQQTLGEASTSSAFLCENGGPSSSSAFAASSQRKPEESPVKDTDAKQVKQEATVNGSGDSSASNGNGVQEGKSQEASDGLMSCAQDSALKILL